MTAHSGAFFSEYHATAAHANDSSTCGHEYIPCAPSGFQITVIHVDSSPAPEGETRSTWSYREERPEAHMLIIRAPYPGGTSRGRGRGLATVFVAPTGALEAADSAFGGRTPRTGSIPTQRGEDR